jgi:hypothetical protein
MTVYRDAEHGVVRAMTLDAISLHKGAAWQNKYHPPGWEPGKSDNPCPLDRFDQLTQDAMTRALLRRVLSPLHWNLLEAFYKVDNSASLQQERARAISYLATAAPGKSHRLFRMKCVTAWAVSNLPEAFMVLHTWDNLDSPTPEKTLYRWRSDIRRWLKDEMDKAFQSAALILGEAGLIAEAA